MTQTNVAAHPRYFLSRRHSQISRGGLVRHALQLSRGPPAAEHTPQTNLGGVVTSFCSAKAHCGLDQMPALARELASLRPDVLIASPYTFVIDVKQATNRLYFTKT